MRTKKIDIVIPTLKKTYEIKPLIDSILSVTGDCNVVASCIPVSAAKNRNMLIDMTSSPVFITVDDDITGFFKGWTDILLKPFRNKKVHVVSARLMSDEKQYGIMMNMETDKTSEYARVDFVPGACCALRRNGLRFDEKYIGSGYEDTDYMMQVRKLDESAKILIANRCKLIHLNEMKNQKDTHVFNRAHFVSKWGEIPI
jgi:hypothetical protein